MSGSGGAGAGPQPASYPLGRGGAFEGRGEWRGGPSEGRGEAREGAESSVAPGAGAAHERGRATDASPRAVRGSESTAWGGDDGDEDDRGYGGESRGKEGSRGPVPVVNRFGFVVDLELADDVAGAAASRPTPVSAAEARLEVSRARKWREMLADWPAFALVHPRTLKRRVRKGIPNCMRGSAWPRLVGADRLQAANPGRYAALLTLRPRAEDAAYIERDLGRTFPRHVLFRDKDGPGQRALRRVLRAYSTYDVGMGFCQGTAFLAGLLLTYMSEEQAFFTFTCLLNRRGLRQLYLPGLPMLQESLFILEHLLRRHCPDLAAHLAREGVHPSMFASQWLLTAFSYSFDFSITARVADVLMHGDHDTPLDADADADAAADAAAAASDGPGGGAAGPGPGGSVAGPGEAVSRSPTRSLRRGAPSGVTPPPTPLVLTDDAPGALSPAVSIPPTPRSTPRPMRTTPIVTAAGVGEAAGVGGAAPGRAASFFRGSSSKVPAVDPDPALVKRVASCVLDANRPGVRVQKVLLRVCLSLLLGMRTELLGMSFEHILPALRDAPARIGIGADALMARAFRLRITSDEVRRLRAAFRATPAGVESVQLAASDVARRLTEQAAAEAEEQAAQVAAEASWRGAAAAPVSSAAPSTLPARTPVDVDVDVEVDVAAELAWAASGSRGARAATGDERDIEVDVPEESETERLSRRHHVLAPPRMGSSHSLRQGGRLADSPGSTVGMGTTATATASIRGRREDDASTRLGGGSVSVLGGAGSGPRELSDFGPDVDRPDGLAEWDVGDIPSSPRSPSHRPSKGSWAWTFDDTETAM